jgi:hypothetical protein
MLKKTGKGGRPPGSKNKSTKQFLQALLNIWDRLGGEDGLYRWVKTNTENENFYYRAIIKRSVPQNLDIELGAVDNEIKITIEHDYPPSKK